MLKKLKDGINKWYDEFRKEEKTYLSDPSVTQGAKPQAYLPPSTPPRAFPPPSAYTPPTSYPVIPPPPAYTPPQRKQLEDYDISPQEEFKILTANEEYNLSRADLRKYNEYMRWKIQQPPSDRPSTRSQGKGIAGYVRGGSIESFVDKAYSLLHIKNIKRYNKSTFIINL